ncbi:MAG: ABC transporter ATP-binding protein [Dehalococcoidales bacterium]|nr:ABC transporter ATP-binding protein [Dehalococcoidales bacterium]
MTELAIRTENLTRDFRSLRALDSLSLEIQAGSIFGFLGPNGAGKTTTINLLLGLLEPTSGKAEVLGFDIQRQADDIRANSGALLEYPGLYEQMNAEENLEFYGRVWCLPLVEIRARTKELLTQMGLWERRGERVAKWSKGMKQKLALSRAMIHRPRLVFLDEPTAGLDVMAATAVRDDLANMSSREGATLFLTTHNMTEAERLCQQVAVVRQGKLLAVGPPDELRKRVGTPRIEITGKGFTQNILDSLRQRPEIVAVELKNDHLSLQLRSDTDTAPLVSLIVSGGAQIEEVHRGRANLEEVFIALMEDSNDH